MKRLRRARPPVIHEQADEEPGDADPVLIINGGVAFRSIDVNVLLVKFDAAPAQSIGCFLRQIVARNAARMRGLHRARREMGTLATRTTSSPTCISARSAGESGFT